MTQEQPEPAPTGFQFEGDFIHDLEGKLPAMTVEMPEAYARGTVLRLNVEVRVKSVRHEENRKGDLVRQHVFALESVNLAAAFKPEEDRSSVGGSASGTPEQTAEEAAELGLTIGRSSDAWDGKTIEVREGEVDPRSGEVIDDWVYDKPEGETLTDDQGEHEVAADFDRAAGF
jgi:hypothetical protein